MTQNEQAFHRLTATENGLVGVLAGTVEVSLLQPILYLKNASQQKLGKVKPFFSFLTVL